MSQPNNRIIWDAHHVRAGYAARWAALVEAVADCFASVLSSGMERHKT